MATALVALGSRPIIKRNLPARAQLEVKGHRKIRPLQSDHPARVNRSKQQRRTESRRESEVARDQPQIGKVVVV